MIFFFPGFLGSEDNPNNEDVLIYKIGDYANFTEVNYFNYEEPKSQTSSIESKSTNYGAIIGVILGSILCITIFGIIGFIIFKWRKKTYKPHKFSHVLGS